ncbi:MAG: site-specific DNA-methyltransferase [Alphaproteobacteria bacterium]|nr:site-specific DNA-methyltransferase [Alphaproteobacteria bacterium]
MKSAKNKTIDISLTDGKEYLERCIYINRKMEEKQILNKTIIGDSLKVMEKLPRSFVDLLIVDPPYNLSKNYHGNKFNKTNNNEYEQYTVAWIEKALPLLKPNASIYVCCDWKSSLVIGPVLQRYFQIQNRITWQREKGRGASHNWKNGMEDIWFATMSNNYIFNLDDVKIRRKVLAPYKENGKPKDWEQTEDGRFRNTCPSNFWDDISIPYWSMPENTAHPTQKPEKLIAKLILASSNKGDVVFDPFLGSGTTSVTAKKLERQYVGIEQNPNYCIWAEKRLELAEITPQIQGYSDGIFWERNVQINKKAPK